MTVDILDPREGMQRMHTPEERHLRDTALQELQTLKEAFAALRHQTLGRDAPDLNATKGKAKGKKGKDVERLLISEITEPTLPPGRDWIPAGHLLSQMEYLWLKKKGVTKAFLDCRRDKSLMGTAITPDIEVHTARGVHLIGGNIQLHRAPLYVDHGAVAARVAVVLILVYCSPFFQTITLVIVRDT